MVRTNGLWLNSAVRQAGAGCNSLPVPGEVPLCSVFEVYKCIKVKDLIFLGLLAKLLLTLLRLLLGPIQLRKSQIARLGGKRFDI